jgi:diguanylate cyclase (GGDEF)-like protein/PAS domain S-box-containing protein
MTENDYEVLFDMAADCMLLLDMNGVIVQVNQSGAVQRGYTRQEMLGRSISEFDPPEYAVQVPERMKALARDGQARFESAHICKDGRVMPVEIHSRLIDLAGIPHVLSVIRDITESRQQEQSIRESEERWKFALEGSGDGAWDWNPQTDKAVFSKRWKAMIGFAEDEFPGTGAAWVAHLHPDDRERVMSTVQNFFVQNAPYYEVEFRMRCKDGSWKWMLARGMLVCRDEQGRPLRMIGTHTDLTERKRTEQMMAEKTSLLAATLESTADGILVVDGEGRITSYNQRFLELWRIPEAVMQSGDDGSVIAHVLVQLAEPDAFVHKVQLLYRDTAAESFDELVFKDGRVFERYSRPQRIGEQIAGRVWSFRDATLRRQAEASLKIAGMVYANSNEAILVVDADNRIIANNPAFTQTTGYTESEVLGQNPKMLSSGRQNSDFYREMWQELNTTGRWQGEMWNRRKNGEVYAEQLSINTIFHPDGSVYRRIALFLDVTEKKKTEEIIWRQANFDALTGLPNRRMLRDRLDQEIKKAQRSSAPLALLFIDLDRFKEINDTLGHHVGDELLIEASRRLESCVRESDTIGRLGGDEFTVLVGQLHSMVDAQRLANTIIEKLAEPYQLGGERVSSSASIGIAIYPEDATQSAQLLQYADQAMYAAKGQGGGRFSFFTPLLQEEAQNRMRLTGELSGALESGQFRVYFQPIVELASNRIFKAEALLRWIHPQRGMISPMSFIPLAEETGLIIPIGDWVFCESVRWVKRWQDISAEGFQISVNKSPIQFCNGDNADVIWLAFLRAAGLTGRNICIEITEGLLLNRDDTTSRKLFSFRDAGIQVSIDDFGTGYSSLSYLKKFDIDYLKIDQSFVRNMVSDPSDLALCEAIVVMAHKLGLKVIAEGVETQAQRDLLIQIGCDFAQGYLFARPMPGEEMEALLASQSSR